MHHQKICTFFVSEYHLLTIILPYINKTINEEKDVVVILEKDITRSVKKYLKIVDQYDSQKEKILSLDWKKENKEVYQKDLSNSEVFIIGSQKFIKKVNSKLEVKVTSKIIDCYYVSKLEKIDEIPENYEYVLKTYGICDIKNSQNIQERKTIYMMLIH